MGELKRIRSDESLPLRMIWCIDTMLRRELGAIEQRVRSIPNGWRDLRMMTAVMKKLKVNLYLTFPEEQRRTFEKTLSAQEFQISAPRLSKDPTFVYMDLDDAKLLMRHAILNECTYCHKSKQDARKCELRKAIDRWSIHDMEEVDGCAFRAFSIADYPGDEGDGRAGLLHGEAAPEAQPL